MRRISIQQDWQQIGLVFFLIFSYFYAVSYITSHSISNFIFFLVSLTLTLSFFYFCGILIKAQNSLTTLITTWTFSLLPTLIWFFLTAILFILLPPPRTTSFLGTIFSLIYIIISLVLLWWKLTLIYLSIRFSLKTDFVMTMFLMIIYGVWFLPYTYALYFFSISRVPFI